MTDRAAGPAEDTSATRGPADPTGGSHDRLVLADAQKMRAVARLTAGVAHELNNQLAAIAGFGQLISSDPGLPDDMRRSAALLNTEADRTRRLVETLTDFLRDRPDERHPTNLRQLVDSVLELAAYAIRVSSVEVEVDVPDDLPLVPVDRQRLQQVLLSLVSNAVEAIAAAGRPGRIAVLARRAGSTSARRVRLTIADDGPGVEGADEARLFQPFFTTKADAGALGLGLAVAAAIVADHGGTLRFEAPPSGGATFLLDLPAAATARAERTDGGRPGTTQIAVDPAPAGRRAVVVVDDEPAVRNYLGRALAAAGHEPILVASGSSATATIIDRPDAALVLCDFRMAGMTGRDVYEAVVAIRPDLARRFVLMSGDVLDPDLRAFAESHGLRLLAKPFDIGTVAQVVGEALAAEPGSDR